MGRGGKESEKFEWLVRRGAFGAISGGMPFSLLGLFGGGGGALVAPFQGWRMFCCGSPGAMPQAGIGCSFGAIRGGVGGDGCAGFGWGCGALSGLGNILLWVTWGEDPMVWGLRAGQGACL